MSKALNIMFGFLASFLGSLFLFYFFASNFAPQLNVVFYPHIFPNPQGNLYYSSLYATPVGFAGIIPILFISGDIEV